MSEVDLREVCGTADRRGAKMFASERGDEGDERVREACECECVSDMPKVFGGAPTYSGEK